MTDQIARPGGDDSSRRLADLAAEAWETVISRQPVFATALGDRRFDDRLRPNAPGDLEREAAGLEALLDRTRRLDATSLSEAERVTRSALIDFLGYERDLVGSGIEAWMVDPLDGPQVTLLNIPSFQPVRTSAEAEAMLERWRVMGPSIDNLTITTRAALDRGVVSPQALVRSVAGELDDLLGRPDADWPLLDPARQERPDWPACKSSRFAHDLAAIVREDIRPAFGRYRAFLVDPVAPRASSDDRPGLASVPGGDATYRRLVRGHTTLDLEPEAIHRIG